MRAFFKKLLLSTAAKFGFKIERISVDSRASFAARFLPIGGGEDSHEARQVLKVRNLLEYTKASNSPYSAEAFDSAYHSIELNGTLLRGQRLPAERIHSTPFDFSGKSVLDLGCNQGGMLFSIAEKVSSGVGIDFDSRMINAANRIRSVKRTYNIDFYVMDLEKEPLDLLDQFAATDKVDIVFLLSVCMWIENWRAVVAKAAAIAPALLFESNGSDSEQAEQIRELSKHYARVTMLRESSPDDPIQSRRKLLICYRDDET
jgi:SAM-dependent methyltransferase